MENTVLIVGAGPTGLVLACELLRRGIKVRLIDKGAESSKHSKALGIQAKTLEIFEKFGIIDEFLKRGLIDRELQIHYRSRTLRIPMNGLPTSYSYVLILPQAETEKILINYLHSLGGSVEWNTQFTGWEGDSAIIQYADGRLEHYQPQWTVGCDGAHSTIRHSLSIPFEGEAYQEIFLITDVKAETPLFRNAPHGFFTKFGIVLVMPLPTSSSFRVIFVNYQDEGKTINAAFLNSLIEERHLPIPFHIKEPEWVSIFRVNRRCVQTLRKGRVFLAGDAAHVHSPAGGQGMNTCIQDAVNLGWKLAMVMQGVNPSLLDSYESERLPIGKSVLKGTTFMTKTILFLQRNFAPVIINVIRFLFKNNHLRIFLLKKPSQLSIHYPCSSIIFQPTRDKNWKKGPQPGERAPDVDLGDGKRLFHLLKTPKYVLVLFQEHLSFQNEIEKRFGKWIEVIVQKNNPLKNAYAAGTESLYLIRPDGYVGYRSRSFQIDETLNDFQRIFKQPS